MEARENFSKKYVNNFLYFILITCPDVVLVRTLSSVAFLFTGVFV